ncbi:hypothetical protein G7Z17_g3773 [Cylindrodendrum hubeiense]|uniref:Uncharacterized protein n=1 Tax=Cylindrodendrum hubeiense TaxID=595255 RepID=A0A9P5HF69_9HYPO|nr:hypothetical protein G7Z17_g3773 [Cylindrodendrum hubeiense]
MGSRIALYASLALLMVVSIIELSFISAMVGWLHGTASGTFAFSFDGSTYELKGEPKNLIVDQGHTSNGAAGTGFILIGLGGFLALWLRSRPNAGKFSIAFYHGWLVTNFLSLLLVLSALIYVFVVTNNHNGQTIDPSVAAGLDGKKYNLDSWTPQNWFSAVLKLDLVDSGVRSDIESHLHIMKGWQYNLIPFFLIHLLETGVAFWDAVQRRKARVPSSVQQKGDTEASH